MQNPTVYSQRLGAISDLQFEAVSTRLKHGHFLQATPTTSGLFGQDVFVTTTAGEFVLRGAPYWVKGIDDTQFRQEDRWQFTKERFFAQQLHERTNAPVPWPMHHDPTSDHATAALGTRRVGPSSVDLPRCHPRVSQPRSIEQCFRYDPRATADRARA